MQQTVNLTLRTPDNAYIMLVFLSWKDSYSSIFLASGMVLLCRFDCSSGSSSSSSSSSCCSRLSSAHQFFKPAVNSNMASQTFSVCGPSVWNSIKPDLRCIDSPGSFKSHLQTTLFLTAYNMVQIHPALLIRLLDLSTLQILYCSSSSSDSSSSSNLGVATRSNFATRDQHIKSTKWKPTVYSNKMTFSQTLQFLLQSSAIVMICCLSICRL